MSKGDGERGPVRHMSVINFIKYIYKQTHKRDPRPSQGGSQKAGGE